MCGLAGLFRLHDKAPIDEALLHRMTTVLAHRGPDGAGFHREPGLGLGHRRLAIIDRAGGRQPIYNEDESVVIVYNGEIYNYKDLAQELETLGHRFRTATDTEVIVHAWEQWGEDCVARLRGMFAFALWDRNAETLFLARDRLGIKPLFYSLLGEGSLVFASELKALLCHPGLRPTLDLTALDDYLAYGYVPDPKSIFQGVAKLEPGHSLLIRRGHALGQSRCYWQPKFEKTDNLTEAQACEELLARLDEAVSLRLMSEVPLGAFLSGGVDSSAVVASMSRSAQQSVNTCSIGFDQAEHDETGYAQEVARRYDTNHHQRRVSAEAFDVIEKLTAIYDEPFADSSAIPTYRLSALAREKVTVALSGDGGDEVFAGYRRHRFQVKEEQVRDLLPQALRQPVFGTLGEVYPKLDWAPRPLRAKATLQNLGQDYAEGYFQSVSIFPKGLRETLRSPALTRALGGYRASDHLRRHLEAAPSERPLDRILYADLKTYLPGDILTKVDRASMAHGLEVRVPFLDHHLVEWAAGLPDHLRLQRGQGKYILKKAMEPRLPQSLLYRSKMGFSIPLRDWLRGPLKGVLEASLIEGRLAESGLFDQAKIGKLLKSHGQGKADHGPALWALFRLGDFLDHHESICFNILS